MTQPTRFPRIQFSRKEAITNLHLFRCIHHTCPRPISPKTSSANSQFISEYCKHQLKLLYTATLCCIINHCLFQSARLLPARDHQKPAGLFYRYNPHYSGAGNPNALINTCPVLSSATDLLIDHLRITAGGRLLTALYSHIKTYVLYNKSQLPDLFLLFFFLC